MTSASANRPASIAQSEPPAAAESVVGHGAFRYRVAANWPLASGNVELGEVTAAASDSSGGVFLFTRTERPVLVFDADGKFLSSWGQGFFARPHGIHIGPDGCVYCTDDLDHTVRKFTADGTLLLTLGRSGQPSDTGAHSVDYRNIRRASSPFHFPTNLALAPNGDMFVTDGYGNARVHRFAPDGRLISSWGAPGDGPGEFRVPHGIAVSQSGVVYVADRENSRIQLFTSDGDFIDAWLDVARPCEVFVDVDENVFVAELGYRAGMFPGNEAPAADATGGRVSVFSNAGSLLARWGGGSRPAAAGDFYAPHDLWIDRTGSIYVSEVIYSAGVNDPSRVQGGHTIQKFVRIEESP